jgi:type II secretory pathway predicted ATPase ExeA
VPDWRRWERPGGGAAALRGGDAGGLRVRHHLALVGRTDPLFSDDAIARLHRAAAGLPRALNNAAVAALIAAASEGKALVDDACAKNAVAELTKAD